MNLEYLTTQNLQRDFSGSILISKGDRREFFVHSGFSDQKNGTPVSETTVFPLASISKLILATLTFQLNQRFQFGLNTKLGAFGYKLDSVLSAMSINELLTHTSGMTDEIKENVDPDLLDENKPSILFAIPTILSDSMKKANITTVISAIAWWPMSWKN